MRQIFALVVVVLLGSTSAVASASFANRSLGLSVSGLKFFGDKPASISTNWVVPIALEGGLYIDSGFQAFLRPQFFFVNTSDQGTIIGGGGQVGVRYLFLEESIRPYAGLYLSVLVFNRAPQVAVSFGPGVEGGVDFFVNDSISLGLRGMFDMFVTLNQPLSFSVGGGANFTTYF